MKKPYQPPPNKEARFGNSINVRDYKPGMNGLGPQIEIPKSRPKPRKAPNASNQWLFDEAEKCKKAKKIEKAMEVVLRRHREAIRQKLSLHEYNKALRLEMLEVWGQ